ncbi:exosome component 10 [Neocloeon triangulifer]|uniref:exosome component 10 n=1 Tax=Neocloeon triangulifer TaxID=2078957 RepID=UPI00286FA10C|nr:exosome component 10 [Neocloeon triangulifer]
MQATDSNGRANSEGDHEFLPGYKSVDDFIKTGYKAVLEMTKLSNSLPSDEHFHYYSSYPAFEEAMVKQGNQTLRSISSVIQSAGMKGNIVRRDMEEKFELLLDSNDTILEQVALNLDEVAGIRKNPGAEEKDVIKVNRPLSGSWNQSFSSPSSVTQEIVKSNTSSPSALRATLPKVTVKPQHSFPDKIDNRPGAFEPKIKEKPHALKPLSSLLMLSDYGECFSHPYEYELDLFDPPEHQLIPVEPKAPRTDQTPLKYVDSPQELKHMQQHLRNYKEIAIDLEHHNYRSFQGFTCLMQISSRHSDFIVDTLKLRGELHCLNEIFADPKIVKVLHGADSDVVWLQKDLGLYLVNMFDTHQAGKLMNFPRLNLAYLLKYYCDVDVDKRYQLADWRIRPLPEEMIQYARMDTHFLLYVYDRLKNDLWESGANSDRLIKAAIHQSTQLCKKIYVKPQLTQEAHLMLYQKSRKMFNNRQLWALEKIFAWRFHTAMEEDESLPYVLPNHMLLQIAENLPREMQGILACCNPIPVLVRQNLTKIHRIILEAREQPLVQTAATEDLSMRSNQTEWTKINIESTLHCPHQLLKEEQRDNLPTLLGAKKMEEVKVKGILKTSATIAVFSAFGQNTKLASSKKKVMSPYQRYLLVKPYLQHLSNLAALKEAADKEIKVDKSSTTNQLELHGLAQVQQHFEELDSRTAAQNRTPVRQAPSESEEEDGKSASVKRPHAEFESLDGKEEEEEEIEGPLNKRFKEDKIQPFRPGRNNLSVAQTQSKFQRNKKTNQQKKKNFDRGQKGNWSNEAPAATQNQPGPSQAFNYNQVNFNKFQGGSRNVDKRKNFNDKGNRGRGGGNKKKRFNFPQRQNQKSHTYKT